MTSAATVDDGAATIKVAVEHKAATGDAIVVTPTLNDASATSDAATVTLTYTAATSSWDTQSLLVATEDGTTIKTYTVSVDEPLCNKTGVQSVLLRVALVVLPLWHQMRQWTIPPILSR